MPQSFNLWKTQVSATDSTPKDIFDDTDHLPPMTVCKPIPELALWLAAQAYLSCVVPLNGQIDLLRAMMGLAVANSGAKTNFAAPLKNNTR